MCVGPVVEAAVGPDGAVDAVDEAHVLPGQPAEAAEVEVERVEETCRGPRRDAIELDDEAAALELRDECSEELVPSAGRWRRELVEECEVGTTATSPGADSLYLRAELARGGPDRTTSPHVHAAQSHAETVVRPAASTRTRRISSA